MGGGHFVLNKMNIIKIPLCILSARYKRVIPTSQKVHCFVFFKKNTSFEQVYFYCFFLEMVAETIKFHFCPGAFGLVKKTVFVEWSC